MNRITIKFGTELKPTKHIVVNYNFTSFKPISSANMGYRTKLSLTMGNISREK